MVRYLGHKAAGTTVTSAEVALAHFSPLSLRFLCLAATLLVLAGEASPTFFIPEIGVKVLRHEGDSQKT